MPFVQIYMSCDLSAENEAKLKAGLGQAIAKIPGKAEANLMLDFKPNSRMWYHGENAEPCAFISVGVKGQASQEAYQAFSDEAIKLLSEICGVPCGNVYLKVDDSSSWFFLR